MSQIREIWQRGSSHRIFIPVLVGAVALTLGSLLAFEHTRNLIKVRGPYLVVLMVIATFPIFAFRFFDPHEDARPITGYFLISAFYYIMLGSPDFVAFLRMLILERLPPGSLKQLLLGVVALAACAGTVHYVLRLWSKLDDTAGRFLAISIPKFAAYAVLHILYLNYLVPFVRMRFGILTIFS